MGLEGRIRERVAKEVLAQISKAADANGKQGHALALPRIARVVSGKARSGKRIVACGKKGAGRKANVSLRGRAKKAAATPKQFHRVSIDMSGVRQVKSPASRSRIGAGRILRAILKASIAQSKPR